MSLVCSCGKDPTSTAGQKCQSFRHTATLFLAVYIEKHSPPSDTEKTEGKNISFLTAEGCPCPFILVYDIMANSENSSKPQFNVNSCIELEKEMMLQDPYTTSGSEDDWMYDQLPILPPDSLNLHSSVLQKFAEAIAGEENINKTKVNKCKEGKKCTKLVQCLELSGICNSRLCKVTEIVPFRDGQNILVNLHCFNNYFIDNGSHIGETIPENEESEQYSDNCTATSGSDSASSGKCPRPDSLPQSTLAVYKIASIGGARTLSSQPLLTKQFPSSDGILSNLVTLPVESHELLRHPAGLFQELESVCSESRQFLVGAFNDSVVIIDADSLKVVTKFKASSQGTTISHILNCPGMDCLCVCCEDGVMHFLELRNQLPAEAGTGTAEDCRDASSISEAPPGSCGSQSGEFD